MRVLRENERMMPMLMKLLGSEVREELMKDLVQFPRLPLFPHERIREIEIVMSTLKAGIPHKINHGVRIEEKVLEKAVEIGSGIEIEIMTEAREISLIIDGD